MNPPPLPRWIWLPACLALAFVALPIAGLASRIPLDRLPGLLTRPDSVAALGLSLRTCAVSTALAVGLGLPLALVMARARGAWTHVARTLAVLPMVLPPVVAGLALLSTLGRRGLLGATLDVAGIQIGSTTAAVVLAQAFVSMPFFVVAVEGALRSLDPEVEHAAVGLGANPAHVLRRVTVPLVGPSLIAGATMAFARALGEFGATLTFAGSLRGVTRTLPLEIYLQREVDADVAVSLSVALIAIAAVLVVLPSWWLRRRGASA